MSIEKTSWLVALVCALSAQAAGAQGASPDAGETPPSGRANLRYLSPIEGYRSYTGAAASSWEHANRAVQEADGGHSHGAMPADRAGDAQTSPHHHEHHHHAEPPAMTHSHGGHE